MKKKYYILALTFFLCILVGQNSYGQMSGGDLDEVIIETPPDSHDPCDPWSSDYDYYTCHGMGDNGSYDSGDPCDPSSSAYNAYQCGGDSGDPCDPFSSAFDYSICYGEEPDTTEPDPCNEVTAANGVVATNMFNSTYLNNKINTLATSLTTAQTGQAEQGFVIYKSDINGNLLAGPTASGTSGNLQVTIPLSAYADYSREAYVHTHPAEAYSAPSAGDIYSLISAANSISTLDTAYIIAADGTKYAAVVTDSVLASAFTSNHPAGTSLNGADFDINSSIGAKFHDIEQSYLGRGYSEDVAYERALAVVLQNSGITLLKAPDGSSTFKKIDAEPLLDANGIHLKDQLGNPIYLNIDC